MFVSLVLAASIVSRLVNESPTVALLPVVTTSAEPNEFFRADMARSASEYLKKGFTANGFAVLDDSQVQGAVSSAGVDLTDEEQRLRENFFKIGEAAKADYIYFAEVEDNGFFSANTGRVVLRVWFLNVPEHKRILSARAVLGESKERLGGGPKRTQVVAASRAAEESLKLCLKNISMGYKAPLDR